MAVSPLEMTTMLGSRPAPGQVRVRHTALGSMAVAVVDAVGDPADGFVRGDRVAFPVERGHRVSTDRPAVVPVASLIGVPRDISDESAARLLVPGLVAREMLKRLRPVREGDTVAVRLAPGLLRSAVESWAVALGGRLVPDHDSADVVYDDTVRRVALGLLAKRNGRFQQLAADVFLAMRAGAFDAVRAVERPQSAAA